MYRSLLCIIVFASFFLTILSIRCFEGYGIECILGDDMKDCGGGEKCHCIKFRYNCSAVDYGCNEKERLSGAFQWGHMVGREADCEELKKPSNGMRDVSCCSTDQCNRRSSGLCSKP